MATLTQPDIKTLMPGSKNIKERIQCVKAFSRQQKRALGSAITERFVEGGGVGGGGGGEVREVNKITLV